MELTNEQKIKAMTDAYLESVGADLPSEEELASQQVLSDRFLQRMDKLVRQERLKHKQEHQDFARLTSVDSESTAEIRANLDARKPFRLNSRHKKRLLIAVIILTILVSAASVSASREAIVGFIVQVFERFSTIVFSTPTETSDSAQNPSASNDLQAREPSFIPEGYHQTEQTLLVNFHQTVYADETGREILYTQQDKSNMQMIIDTEGTQIEKLTINGYQAIYFANKDVGSVIWEDELYAYIVSGKIARDELIRIANSTMEEG